MKKCWPFFHDWEIIRSVGDERLKEDTIKIIKQGDSNEPIPPSAVRFVSYGKLEPQFVEKICMKCETYVDEITPQMAVIRIDHFMEEQRKKLAKERAVRAKNILDKIKREGRTNE